MCLQGAVRGSSVNTRSVFIGDLLREVVYAAWNKRGSSVQIKCHVPKFNYYACTVLSFRQCAPGESFQKYSIVVDKVNAGACLE